MHPSLVNVGVGALDPPVDVAALLLCRVYVLVAVDNVARLVLCLELATGHRVDWSRLWTGQLGVLGIGGCVLAVDNWGLPLSPSWSTCVTGPGVRGPAVRAVTGEPKANLENSLISKNCSWKCYF